MRETGYPEAQIHRGQLEPPAAPVGGDDRGKLNIITSTIIISMKIQLRVTQEHIDHGQRKDCDNCPIASAMTDMAKTGVLGKVGFSYMHWHREGQILFECNQPVPMYQWRLRFDRNLPVQPATFELEVPDNFAKEYLL